MVTNLHAPPVIDPKSDKLKLKCEYDLHGNELYTVNWYRNEEVLFRYSPSLEPKFQFYPGNTGLKISLKDSNAEQLVLVGQQDMRKSKY